MNNVHTTFWWAITVTSTNQNEEALYALADLSGGIGAELLENNGVSTVKIFFRSDKNISYWHRNILEASSIYPGIQINGNEKIENQPWHIQSEEAFPPLPVGDRFVVLAVWHASNHSYIKNIHETRIPLIVNPGNAFGTGYHESTQIALELLERHPLHHNSTVLDLGTGSGILSIAAVKLGANKVIARDIDPISIQEVIHNQELNSIPSEKIQKEVADGLIEFDVKVDIIIANILFDILIPLLYEVKKVLNPGGIVIFSGLLQAERPRFIEKMNTAGLTVLSECSKKDWWGVIATSSS